MTPRNVASPSRTDNHSPYSLGREKFCGGVGSRSVALVIISLSSRIQVRSGAGMSPPRFSLKRWISLAAPTRNVRTGSRGDTGLVNEIRNVYLRLREKVSVVDDDRFGILYDVENSVALCWLHQFGWLRLDYGAKPKAGKASSVCRVERTDFGDAMFVATCNLGPHENEKTVILHEKLQPIFPAWANTLTRSEPAFREGNHTFKVSLGKIWRGMVATADAVLDELADAILMDFRFDSEHLYQFELRDAAGNSSLVADVGSSTRSMRITFPCDFQLIMFLSRRTLRSAAFSDCHSSVQITFSSELICVLNRKCEVNRMSSNRRSLMTKKLIFASSEPLKTPRWMVKGPRRSESLTPGKTQLSEQFQFALEYSLQTLCMKFGARSPIASSPTQLYLPTSQTFC